MQIKAATIEETQSKEKPTCIAISRKSRIPSRKQNVTANLESNTKPDIHERLRSVSPTNNLQKQGKSLSRTISKTSNANDDKQKNE